jgi:hypothetical protein
VITHPPTSTPARNLGFFTVGATKDDVLNLQGQPTWFSDYQWNYGTSTVSFANGKVTNWSSGSTPLKARLVTRQP